MGPQNGAMPLPMQRPGMQAPAMGNMPNQMPSAPTPQLGAYGNAPPQMSRPMPMPQMNAAPAAPAPMAQANASGPSPPPMAMQGDPQRMAAMLDKFRGGGFR